MASTALLRSLRLLHLYIGVFIAPALLFFAFSGALQTFSLHETTRGSTYQPPHWAVVLAQIHKKQTSVLPERRPPAPTGTSRTPEQPRAAADSHTSPAEPRRSAQSAVAPATPEPRLAAPRPAEPASPNGRPNRHSLPLKIFFLLVALGLFTSTLSGIYMAFKYNRNPRLVLALLLLGAIVPVALIFV